MEKNKNEKISSIEYFIVFLFAVIGLGIASFTNLVNFYVNDLTDYNEWNAELGNKFETDQATCFYQKFEFINLNGLMRNILGQHEMNGVVKLNNGSLTGISSKTSDEALHSYCESVKTLNNYLDSQGIELLYATTPYTVSKYDPQLPLGKTDYGNDNIDRFMKLLDNEGIDTIDFREEIYNDGLNQYDMMYKTDHHWTTKCGFYAYCKLENYLTDKLGCEVDERISNIDNYTVTTYKKWHLGSNGQRTGIYFAGIDDFDLIIPDFETKIQRGEDVANMQDLVINMAPLSNKKYTSRYTYDYVLDRALGEYKNLDCKNDKKILIMTDSFGKSVNPYLIMGFSEIRTLQSSSSDWLSKQYIDEYQPDAVIIMYYPSVLNNESTAFNFSGF